MWATTRSGTATFCIKTWLSLRLAFSRAIRILRLSYMGIFDGNDRTPRGRSWGACKVRLILVETSSRCLPKRSCCSFTQFFFFSRLPSTCKSKDTMVKRGPPYEDDPDCQYIVIDSPWVWSGCQNKAGNKRDREFFNWVAVWLSFMLNPRVWPEELYYQSTVCTIYSISA